jgi:Xaa-Pro dipeptidase
MGILPFSNEEYSQRLEKIKKRMVQEDLDAIILTRAQNIYWVAGYRAAVMNWTLPLLPLIITQKGEMRFMTRVIECSAAETQLAPNPRFYKDHEDHYAMLAELIEDCGVAAGTIGVEEAFMTVFQFNQMKIALPKANLKNASWLVENIRIALSEQEVAYYRKAAEMTNIGFQKGLDLIQAGLYPYEIIAEIQHAMYKAGQSDVEVPKMWIWSGPKGGYMHDTAVNRRLNANDIATVEVWGTESQYMVGAQGTVFLGKKPNSAILDEHKLVADMYLAAKDALKPGAISGDTYKAASNVYRAAKGQDYWRRVGANMGLSFGPVDMGMTGQHVIEPWTPFILQIVEVEPALVTCCSTLMVTDSDCEELTPPQLEMQCIP